MSNFEEPTFEDQPKPEPANKAPATSLIPIGADGKVAARDNMELMRYCGAMLQGDGVPDRFNTPQKLFAALMYVRDLQLPDTAIRQVAVIHGVMAAFGDLPLAMAQRTGELTTFREEWFDKDYNKICFENKNLTNEPWGAVCFMSRNKGVEQSFSFTVNDAERAGMLPARRRDGSLNLQSPWIKYQAIMLRYKARSIGLKSVMADAINGVAIAEYDFDELPSVDGDRYRDVSPEDLKNAASDKINQVLGGVK